VERHRQRNLSYDHGASLIKLRTDTLGDALDATAARVPDQTALVVREQRIRWTWRELAERAETFAAGLLALGLGKGDRVGIWSPNNAEWVLAQYALAKAGLICVTLNPAYRLHEIEYSLNEADCAALITVRAFRSGDFIGLLADLMPELPHSVPGALHAARVPALRWVIQIGPNPAPGCLAFDPIAGNADAAARTRLAAVGETLQFDDPVCIQFTSGTTGAPKGTTLSHHNVINNAAHFGELMRLRAGEKVCSPVPMFHVFGYVGAGVIAAVTGATVVLPAAAFDPLATLQAIHEERCTALYGVPTMFVAELGHPEFNRFDLTCLRTGVMAGAVCPEPLMRQAIERMYMREMLVVGMTETSPCSTGTLPR
jgi:fatty-acyl-CoA synthase